MDVHFFLCFQSLEHKHKELIDEKCWRGQSQTVAQRFECDSAKTVKTVSNFFFPATFYAQCRSDQC